MHYLVQTHIEVCMSMLKNVICHQQCPQHTRWCITKETKFTYAYAHLYVCLA